MIAAATRFFQSSPIQLDPRDDPDNAIDFEEEFAHLEDRAKNLYSKRFSTSTLAKKLDAVKDVMSEINTAEIGRAHV